MATKTVKKQKLEAETKEFIVRAIQEILNDPDLGLEPTPKATKRLHKAMISKKAGTDLDTILKKYHR